MLTVSRRTYLRIKKVPSAATSPWRVTDGGEHPFDVQFATSVTFPATPIARGDLLYCELTQCQTITPNGLRSEITITDILTHHSAAPRLI